MHFNIKARASSLFQPGDGLYQRTVRSGAWAFALRITEQVFSIARLIILARILAPDDFGLMGIALLAMMAIETFSQTGFHQALIQKKEDIKDYLDGAWTAMLLRSLILFVILFFAAPYVATFFEAPQATTIIRVIGISLLLGGVGGVGGFANIGVIYFQKELEFNKQFIYRASGTLADFIVAVSAVLILGSVWALVFGLLAGNLVRLIVSYLVHPYRPHFKLDLARTKELFGFGRWILGSSILIFLITQGDDIFVGKLLGIALLGFYQMAYRFSNAPATEITHVISQVTFPAYSKLQENLPGLREGFLKTLQVTAFISIPLAAGIFILAPEFTTIFLGEKWMPMVPAMQVLALWGLIRSIGATTGPVFHAVGKPAIATKLQFVQLILLAILIYPLSMRWGILGASLAVLFSGLAANLPAVPIVSKLTGCGIRNFCKMITLPLINAAIMISTMLILKTYCISLDGILEFILFIVIGTLIYLGIAALFDKFFGYGVQLIIRETLSQL